MLLYVVTMKSAEHTSRIRTFIEVDDARLSVVTSGKSLEGSSPRLFIQGLGCEAEVIWADAWDKLALSGNERQCIAFDTRGIGTSTGWPDSLEQMADDAAAVLKSQTTRPVEVVGHSLGGLIAMLLGARHPALVSSLVLMDSTPQYSEKTRSGFQWRAERISDAQDVTTIFDIVIPRSFGNYAQRTNPQMIERFQAMLARQSPDVYAHICTLAANANAWNAFDTLHMPILFVTGSEDVSTSSEIMRPLADKKEARLVEVPDAGHNPPLEQPAVVAKIITEAFQL